VILLECVLGIDIGTSGAKALIVSGDGRMIASAAVEYSLSHPRPGWAEQDPCVWWEATVKAIRQCLAKAEASSCPPGNNGSGLSVEAHIKVALLGSPDRCTARCFSIPAARHWETRSCGAMVVP